MVCTFDCRLVQVPTFVYASLWYSCKVQYLYLELLWYWLTRKIFEVDKRSVTHASYYKRNTYQLPWIATILRSCPMIPQLDFFLHSQSFSRPNALASASPMQDISTPVIVPSIPKKLKDLGPCTADEVQKNHVTRWGNQLVESGTFEPRFRTCLNNVEHDQEEMIDNRVEAITKTCKMTLEACARFSTAEANKKRLILNCYQMKTKTYDKLLSSNKYSRHQAVAECHSPFVDASTLIESTMIRIFSRILIHATQL